MRCPSPRSRGRLLRRCALLMACITVPVLAHANVFTDPEDGYFDLSEWLLDRRGFLPVPIIIPEPAIGYGGGAALLFFRGSIRDAATRTAPSGRVTPPDIYGVMFGATENGTKFLGGGALVTFAEDTWRYRGGVGKTDVNLKFYGVGESLADGARDIGYSLRGIVSLQQALRRLGDSNHFIGAKWLYLDLDTQFDPGRLRPTIAPPGGSRFRSSGIGVSWEYDGRDNFFTPSRGTEAAVDTLFFSPGIGSDASFRTYRAYVFTFAPLGKELVLGGRLDGRAARGDVPFYQLPYIELRGIPAARYQDENAFVAEAELRWNLSHRWALVGFGGGGRVWGRRASFSEVDTVWTKGLGFRYLLSRRMGIYAGLDYAKGPEDHAIYIQVGSAWR